MRDYLLDNDGFPLPPMLSTDEAQAQLRKCTCDMNINCPLDRIDPITGRCDHA